MAETTKKAICRWCNSRCRVLVHVEGDNLVSVEEDPDFPMQIWPPLKACVRRLAAREWFYHPDRLNYPLKRAGERGEGKWQQISWQEAFDEIAGRIGTIRDEFGAEAVAHTSGTGRTSEEFRMRFFNLFGSPNKSGAAAVCHGPRAVISKAVYGWWGYISPSVHTGCAVLWGRAPEESWPKVWYAIREIKKAGKKLIVIDPRRTESAAMADIHLALRPGTDCALALAMLNVIINEGLYDKEFVDKWCYGFEELKERVQQYPPERVADITWLSAGQIRETARTFARNKPAAILEGMGIEHLENNSEFLLARYALSAITGNIGIQGGEILSGSHPKVINENVIELNEMLPPEQRRKALGSDRFRLFSRNGYDIVHASIEKGWGKGGGTSGAETGVQPALLWRAVTEGKPYRVRAIISSNNNPMVTMPNTRHVYQALKAVDLYVVVDFVLTPSAELADYVLPDSSWMERPCLFTGMGNNNFVYGGERALPPTVPGRYDRCDAYSFWKALAVRLGQEQYWPWKNWEEVYDYRLKPMGLTFKEFMDKGGKDFPPVELRSFEKKGFGTPTGKVELCSTIFKELDYDPLPAYREPSETPVSQPELAKEYPFILLTGGRHMPFFHSEFRHVESLRKRHPEPLVQVHPETATKLGIANGDWVWIETPRGRCRQKCQYFDGMNPQIVHAQHGWWFPELPGEEPWLHGIWESNINVCTPDDPAVCNPALGAWPLRTGLCRIYKAKEYK